MLLYKETVVWRGKKVETIREGLKAMSFTKYFGKDATKTFFLGGKPDVFDWRRMVNLVKLKESDDPKITQVSQWFHSYITELNETMLRKLLKFCTGFNDPASFDEQFISSDFSPNEVLPELLRVPSICFFL